MEKMQAIGAPFPIEYSSCSDIKPKLFEWTENNCDIKVFIDGAIAQNLNYKKKTNEKKIAWVCESRAIFHSWMFPEDLWEKNIQRISNSFDTIYVSDRRWCKYADNIKFAFAGSNVPWTKDKKVHHKTKSTSMIASPKIITFGHKLRHAIATKHADKIDVFGGANGSKRFGDGVWPNKAEAMNDYMFSVAIENDSYTTYFTEKITDCFASGTVPIYWGTPDIGNYFDKDGIIELTPDFDFSSLTADLYQSKISAIKNNFEKVMTMELADDVLFKLITNEN
jgi:hypothetical protein